CGLLFVTLFNVSNISGRRLVCFFFSSRRRHTRFSRDWSSDVCSSDLLCRIEGPPDSNRKSTDRSFQSLIPQCHQRPIPILGRQRGEVFDRPCRFPVVGDVIRRQLGEVGHRHAFGTGVDVLEQHGVGCRQPPSVGETDPNGGSALGHL